MIIEEFLSWMQSAPVPKRAQAVGALARAYLHSEMTYEDRVTAESAMTILLEDPACAVRFALADALASSKNAPRHIIMGLATDSAEIATMILARSPIFSDGELVDLVASGTVEQQIAIACRGQISTSLCGAIAEVGVVEACLGLLMNKSARYSNKVIHRIAERHGSNAEIRKILLANKGLDADTRLLLIDRLGAELENFVSAKNWLPKPRINKAIRETLDKSSIVSAALCDETQVERLVDALIGSRRLTTAYLLRAICMGNITLFCVAISKLSDIPAVRVESMISKNRHSAFRAAYVKAGLPLSAFEVFSTALNVWRGLLSEPDWISRARMPYLVTRQLVGKYQGKREQVVDELLLLLQKISADMARDEARTRVQDVTRKKAAERIAITQFDLNETARANESQPESSFDESLFDAQMEQSIARALEEDIIEISENDMRIPDVAANDSPIRKEEAQTVEPLEVSLLSNAA